MRGHKELKIAIVCALTLGWAAQAHALTDQTTHYNNAEAAAPLADPDEHSGFADGEPSTSYGGATRDQFYLGDGGNAGAGHFYTGGSGGFTYGAGSSSSQSPAPGSALWPSQGFR